MKLRPPKKLPDTHSRHNTRPMRSRQPLTMLGESVFTSLVDNTDERPDEHTLPHVHTPPYCSSIEAITTKLESHQIDVVELTSPSTSSPWHPSVVNFAKPSLSLSGIGSPRKVQFSPEVRMSEFHPSGLPSELIEATKTPVVFDRDKVFRAELVAVAKNGLPGTSKFI